MIPPCKLEKNIDTAVEWFKKAEKCGFINAQYNLGMYYFNSKQDRIDAYLAKEELVKWRDECELYFKKVARQGMKKELFEFGQKLYWEYGLNPYCSDKVGDNAVIGLSIIHVVAEQLYYDAIIFLAKYYARSDWNLSYSEPKSSYHETRLYEQKKYNYEKSDDYLSMATKINESDGRCQHGLFYCYTGRFKEAKPEFLKSAALGNAKAKERLATVKW